MALAALSLDIIAQDGYEVARGAYGLAYLLHEVAPVGEIGAVKPHPAPLRGEPLVEALGDVAVAARVGYEHIDVFLRAVKLGALLHRELLLQPLHYLVDDTRRVGHGEGLGPCEEVYQ